MVPPIALTIGKGRGAVRLLVAESVTMATTAEQRQAVKPPRRAPGLAGRWRWDCTDLTAGQVTVTGRRRAGPLDLEIQGQVKQTRSGWTQSGWVYTVTRRSDRKGTPSATNRGRASSYALCVAAAYAAAIGLEAEVCGVRTVARNTRAGRTFEAAALATVRKGSSKKRQPAQGASVELEPTRTKSGRKSTPKTTSATRRNGKNGQKKTAAKTGRKTAAKRQGSLFG